jgi:hypothetical protein
LQLDFEPDSAAEKVGDALGLARRLVKGVLASFKETSEECGEDSGGWRGEVGQSPTR